MFIWRTLTNVANSIIGSKSCRVPDFVNTRLLEHRHNMVETGGSCLLAPTVKIRVVMLTGLFLSSLCRKYLLISDFLTEDYLCFFFLFSGVLMFERGSCYIHQNIIESLIPLPSAHESEKYSSVPPHPA